MLIELRSGFCDPDGELLGVLDRPGWRRVTHRRKGEVVDELVESARSGGYGKPMRGFDPSGLRPATSSGTGTRPMLRG
jgi:hypothetical protein